MHLDIEQVNLLSPADRERYMDLERLFASKGWKIVKAMAEANARVAHDMAANAPSWADNRVAVGNKSAWLTVLNLEESTEAVYEQQVSRAAHAIEIEAISAESDYE